MARGTHEVCKESVKRATQQVRTVRINPLFTALPEHKHAHQAGVDSAHFLKEHKKALNPANGYSFPVSIKDRNAYTKFQTPAFFPLMQCIFKLQKNLCAPKA